MVSYAFLIVTLVGAAAVTLAYRPIRREPFTVVSFVSGWVAGELAFQNIVWQMIASAIFISLGALHGWAGWLGLAVAVVDWVGLLGLGIAGRRAAAVTAAALDEVRSDAFPVPTEPTAPTWGRWWRVTRAIPLKSRAVHDLQHRLLGRRHPPPPPRRLPLAPRGAREGPGHGVHPRRGLDHR